MMKNKRKYLILIKAGIAAAAGGACIAGCIFTHEYSTGLDNMEKMMKNIQELSAEQNTLQKEIQELNKKNRTAWGEKNPQEQEKESAEIENQAIEPENHEEGQEAFPGLTGILSEAVQNGTDQGEAWGIAVKECTNGNMTVINDQKMIAASLIKLYIMGAVYESYDNLCQKNGEEYIDQLLTSMITVSDNEAANHLVRLLGQGDEDAGKQAVNVFCVTNDYTSSNMGRMLLETGTDKENYTSPQDCVKFLWDIYQGVFPHSQDMLELLKAQERTGKIPAGIPDGVETANKTGELENVENDAAIVWAGEHPYIVCIMSSNLQNASEARERIVSMSSLIYEKSQE